MSDSTRFGDWLTRGAATLAAALVAVLVLVSAHATPALALPTNFTYQGQLKKNGTPYTGTADFTFRLYTAAAGGTLVSTEIRNGVTVSGGVFTTQLAFGGAVVFDGGPRWIEIAATTPGDGPTILTPRQEVGSVPYSLRSGTAETGGASQWTTNGTSIHYTAGNVGIGITNPSTKLQIDTGTASINPAFFQNNNPDFACFATQNLSANGMGYYDAWSARHFISGSLGVGALFPEAKIHVDAGTKLAIKARAVGGAGSPTATAVWGIGDGSVFSGPAVGVYGQSDYGDGVQGVTSSSVWYGGYFDNTAGGTALFVDGLADVRSLRILGGADIVEGFDARGDDVPGGKPEPGTVLVIDEARAGELRTSSAPYDRKVAGVVSGANGVEHGMKLGQDGKLDGEMLVAMTGRVYVKCSNENGAIRPGDLLTTSAMSGHAMRATDHALSNGAVIGKAMSTLDERTGLVLVLVNLQ